MPAISTDEFEQLRAARAAYIENAAYSTASQASAFAAAIRVLMIFPEQVILPGGESFRNNHTTLQQLLRKVESDIGKLNATSSVNYLHPHLRR